MSLGEFGVRGGSAALQQMHRLCGFWRVRARLAAEVKTCGVHFETNPSNAVQNDKYNATGERHFVTALIALSNSKGLKDEQSPTSVGSRGSVDTSGAICNHLLQATDLGPAKID